METLRDYEIHSRYLVAEEGWRHETETVENSTMEDAWVKASKQAKILDKTYGSEHFWTVTLSNPDGGEYVQLFHGRLM